MGLAWPIGTIVVVGGIVALIGVVGGHIAEEREKAAREQVAEQSKTKQKQSAAMTNAEELVACR